MAEEAEPLPESETEDATEQDIARLQEVWDRALTRFDAVAIPQQQVRADALEARRFCIVPGAMWEGAWGEQNENAPRPEVDKTTKGREKIENDYRQNRLTVDFKPANGAADEETADLLDDMFRADAYDFGASEAWDNAFLEARDGGFGAFRVTTDYADPYDPEDDAQRINPGVIIPDADQSVYFFGGVRQDHSDADAAFILTRDLRLIAEQKWGAENCTPWSPENWKYQWDWYTPDVICTAEYYEVEDKSERLLIFENKLTEEEQRFFASEIDGAAIAELTAQGWTKRTRSIKRKRIHKYILNGTRVLKDCGYIAGENIPIVPVYGRRAIVDSLERFWGYVQKKMDSQRILNTRLARMVEVDSLSPFEVPVFDPSQMTAELADEWARASIDRLPFLRSLALRNEDGSIAQNGPIYVNKPPDVPAVTAALMQFALQMLSDDDDPAQQVKANVSAEAMDIAAERVDALSGIYLDNARIGQVRLGEVYVSMAREIYYEPGRKVPTRTLDGEDGEATLQEPAIDDASGVYKVRNDLTRGRYKVVADVQESTSTKQQKTVRQCLELAQAFTEAQSPQDALSALYIAVLNMDGEGMRDFQASLRKKAVMAGVVKPTKEEEAQMRQATQEQQPDPAAAALGAQAQKLASEAQLNQAKTVQVQADAQLKVAQAQAVGGPAEEPGAPTGLHQVEIDEKGASAELKLAQADHLRQTMQDKRVQLGHEMSLREREHGLAKRAQDHLESQPRSAA